MFSFCILTASLHVRPLKGISARSYHALRKYGQRGKFSTAAITTSENAEINMKENELYTMELPTNENGDLLRIRHTTAHVMAMAVQRLHPDAKVTIGPWIDNGYLQLTVST